MSGMRIDVSEWFDGFVLMAFFEFGLAENRMRSILEALLGQRADRDQWKRGALCAKITLFSPPYQHRQPKSFGETGLISDSF